MESTLQDPYQSPEVETAFVHDDRFAKCPRCESVMDAGFADASTGFLAVESMGGVTNTMERLEERTVLKRLTTLQLQLFRSHLYRECGCYIVDTSSVVPYSQASQK